MSQRFERSVHARSRITTSPPQHLALYTGKSLKCTRCSGGTWCALRRLAMNNLSARWLSYVGILTAAVASMATSPPSPDWALEDSAEGEVALEPDQEATTFRVRASAAAVDGSLSVSVALDPAPTLPADRTSTPIVLFVSAPVEENTEAGTMRLTAIPSLQPDSQGFDVAGGTTLTSNAGDKIYEVRIAWDSPNREDRIASKYDPVTRSNIPIERPLAPRRTTKVRWKATATSSGYDDMPSGAAVHVEVAP